MAIRLCAHFLALFYPQLLKAARASWAKRIAVAFPTRCYHLPVDRCEVIEVRSLEDAQGYACPQQATAECEDCGRFVCGSHSWECAFRGMTFCTSCLSFPTSEHSKSVATQRQPRSARRPDLFGTWSFEIASV